MSANIGSVDRVVRIVAGIGLIVFGFIYTGELRWLGLAGPVLIVTALVRFCPAYAIVGIRTRARA